jgi:RND family efflux transporter MFP subunit
MTKFLRSVLAVTAGVGLTAGCTKVQTTEAPPPRPVRAQAVAAAPPQGAVRYSATIEPFQQVPLAFKASGYVADVVRRNGADGRMRVAQAGDRVTKGIALARVHESDYTERVNQARAKLAEGEASLKKAQLDLARAKTLFAAESLTKPDLDSAQAAFDSAEARVVAARAEIELATSALRDCSLITPSDGVLLERKIEVGTLVQAGSVGFVLGDVSSVKARFGIPDAMVQSVKLGDRIGVLVEAIDATTFAGRVTAIAPTADAQSRVFDVEVTIPNAEGQLRPGMIGTVALAQTEETRAASARPLTVPLTAIVKSNAGTGNYAVLVLERRGSSDVARLRHVELGEVLGNAIAVLKGVNTGDRVIVSGANLVTDGEAVKVLP